MGLQWVEDREEGDLQEASDRSNSSESKGRADKGEPWSAPCPPGWMGIAVADPIPWYWGHHTAPASPLLVGWADAPPRRSDIQAFESCSFPFCSHSPIFLFYLHCHLLALISSLAWGKLPKLDYKKVRARTPAAVGGSRHRLRRY